MSELIKGREVFEVLERGNEAEYKYKGIWISVLGLRVCDILDDSYEFRLKPRTITINGIEVPKPDYIQHGRVGSECSGWYIDIGGTYFLYKNRKDYDAVVAALRSIFVKK